MAVQNYKTLINKAMVNVKNKCASCGKEFKNSEGRYFQSGNYCDDCNSKIENMMKWRKLKHAKVQNIEKMSKLSGIIFKRWGIDMELNDQEFQGFRESVYKILKVVA